MGTVRFVVQTGDSGFLKLHCTAVRNIRITDIPRMNLSPKFSRLDCRDVKSLEILFSFDALSVIFPPFKR